MPDSSKDTTASSGTGASGSDQSTDQFSSQQSMLRSMLKVHRAAHGMLAEEVAQQNSRLEDFNASYNPSQSEVTKESLGAKTDQAREEAEQLEKSQGGGDQSGAQGSEKSSGA